MSYREEYIIKNPVEIGGRSTDVAQIGYDFEAAVKQAFPINGVPALYAEAVQNLRKLLEVAEAEIARVAELLREDGE